MEYCSCGELLPENARFCPACGRARAEEPATIPEPEAEELLPPEPVTEETPIAAPAEQTEAEPVTEEPVQVTPDVPEEHAPPEEALPKKPRKHRPVLIPVAIMTVMLVIGTVCFFLMPHITADVPESTKPVMGEQNESTIPLPPGKDEEQQPSGDNFRSEDFIPTDERCFVMKEDGLHFLPQKYDGSKVLVIPNEIDGVSVTAIAPYGFTGCEGVTTLVLPDSLETIGAYAFAGCAELRGVWFPAAMREIGEGAFRDCIGLESVAVQSGMEVIGKDAFTGCARLLYFFYDGNYEDWIALYNEYVTPYTSVTCLDGDYYHGVELP